MSGMKACRAQTKDMSCILCYTIVTFVTFDLECDMLRSSPKHITLPANNIAGMHSAMDLSSLLCLVCEVCPYTLDHVFSTCQVVAQPKP